MGKMDKKVGGIRSVPAAQMSPTETAEQRQWRAEEDLRTITRAHEIHSDKGRIGEVTKLAKKQMGVLARVADHAHGATTRSRDSGRNASRGATRDSGPPKAMNKGNQGGKRK